MFVCVVRCRFAYAVQMPHGTGPAWHGIAWRGVRPNTTLSSAVTKQHRFIPFVREYLEAMEDEYYLALKEAIFNYKRRDPAKEKQLAVLRLR